MECKNGVDSVERDRYK